MMPADRPASPSDTAEECWVRLALPLATLERMLASQQLCAADFRCLDSRSKQRVWHLCLLRCSRQLVAERPVDLRQPWAVHGTPPLTTAGTSPEERAAFSPLLPNLADNDGSDG